MFKRKGTPSSSKSTSPIPMDLDYNNEEDNEILAMDLGNENNYQSPPIEVTATFDIEDDPNPAHLSEDTELNPGIHFDYTRNHPWGNILLKLLHENTKLAKKVNLKSMELSVGDLCTQFYNGQMLEKQKIRAKIMQTTHGLEDSLIQRELNSHTINQSVEAPSYYSSTPTLLTPRQRGDCLKLLPSGSNKFSGDRNGMNILEFLHLLKSLQAQCRLSLPEFLEMMLASTTGNAYLLIHSWIDNGDDPSTIFHNLLVHYDTRLQPEQARIKLMAYKAPKSADLAKVEATIQSLASRAASNIPAGPGRIASYNTEVIQGLIRSLPPASSLIVQTQNNEKTAKMGRAITAAELSRFLNTYRHAIDMDIKTHGVDNRIFEKRFVPRAGKVGTKKYVTYNINGAVPLHHQPQVPQIARNSQISQITQNHRPNTLGGNRNYSSGNNNMRKAWVDKYGTRDGRNNYKPIGSGGHRNKAGQFTQRRHFNGSGRPNYSPNIDYCSLCGKQDHKASGGCPNMISDGGKQINIMPTKDVCKRCPPHINPRLSHPEFICPYRKSGPWGKL